MHTTLMYKKDLTDNQQKVLSFLETKMQREGEFPSMRDIQAHFDYASPTSAQQYVTALHKKGYLTKRGRSYDFARDYYYLSRSQRRRLEKFVHGLINRLGESMRECEGRDEKAVGVVIADKRRQFRSIMNDLSEAGVRD